MTTLGGDVWRWRRLAAAIEDLDHALTTDEHIEVVRAVPVMLAEIERLSAAAEAVEKVRTLADEYAAAVEPDGGTSVVPATWVALELRAVLPPVDGDGDAR